MKMHSHLGWTSEHPVTWDEGKPSGRGMGPEVGLGCCRPPQDVRGPEVRSKRQEAGISQTGQTALGPGQQSG